MPKAGVLLHDHETALSAVATDGHRLVLTRVPGAGGLLREAARIVRCSTRDWLAAPLFWDRTDPRALRVQMRAVRGLSQLGYVLRLLVDARLRVLVTRQNWLAA